MIAFILKWLLPMVDFKVQVSVITDNVYLVLKYKDTIIFQHTFDVLNDGVEVINDVKQVEKLAK